ncbi:glycoside hydrolase family 38 [Methanothermus fervidus DSM 2088]|uniref:Glycoside hydrolase family 38 n=1 Tax=Methanothermus fervidus (strain ATCC 43054 / DSM 2088 / JCM 10308 / V24 S) TaxID=523846 RepID=E3GYG4_METFV|nr:glycoside hydrolase family 38 C-terminal domain-containing protein [Methanothermus fervidus]ADP77346.1 glycoside hydrolase family 38 [Methanothermus fervidus DSM 2088]
MSNNKYVIHLVPHTHYDAVWVFTKEDYFYINIDMILKKVLKLIENSEEYKFLLEQVYLLEEIEKRYPKMFKKIKKYIKEGRIEIADGEYLMADTMLPQEETLVREIMVGKNYVKEKFGVDVDVMWQADSFGLNAQLPQIYRKCGYKYLAFRRGSPENNPSEFLWEGLDGTRILSHFMPLGYRAGLNLEKIDENFKKLKELSATNHILMPSGSGVTMPQKETIEFVKKWNRSHKNSKIKISTPKEFFKSLEDLNPDLPIRKGEMYSGKYSEVFPDVASSRIWIKKALRKFENWLYTFERFSTINFLLNSHYPEELPESWKKLLFMAFHDVAPGTGVDVCYNEVKENIKSLERLLNDLTPQILMSIVEKGDKEGDVVVYNPLSWDSKNWVEVDLKFDKGAIKDIKGLKCGEEEIDVEVIKFRKYDDGSIKTARIGFIAEVPALGYKIYKILQRPPKSKTGVLEVSDNSVRNKFFEIKFSPDTGLIKIVKNGEEICEGNEIVIEEEIGDLYYHKEGISGPLKTESGEGIKYGAFKVKDIKITGSKLRKIINIAVDYYSLRWPYRLTKKWKPRIWRHKFLKCKKKIIVYRDIPRIDFVIDVENRHPRTRLRVKFNTPIDEPTYKSDTQFGAITRKTNQYYFNPKDWKEKPSGVYPTLRWIDYSNGKIGVALINFGNPEHEIRDRTIYLTLLRSVDVLSTDGKPGPVIPVPDAREFKRYEFWYSIYPHTGNWKDSKVYKQGYEFNYGLIGFQINKKVSENKKSFLKIEPDNVILTAFKKSERDDSVIIRFYEAAGIESDVKIKLFKKPKNVETVDILERKTNEFNKNLKVENNKIYLKIKPFEIITLKLKF